MFSPSFIFHFFSKHDKSCWVFLILSFYFVFASQNSFCSFLCFLGEFLFLSTFPSAYLLIPQSAHTRVHKQIIHPFLRQGSFLCEGKKVRTGSFLFNHFCQVKNHCPSSRFTGGLFSSWLFIIDGKWICHCNSLRIKVVDFSVHSRYFCCSLLFSLFQRCWLLSQFLLFMLSSISS